MKKNIIKIIAIISTCAFISACSGSSYIDEGNNQNLRGFIGAAVSEAEFTTPELPNMGLDLGLNTAVAQEQTVENLNIGEYMTEFKNAAKSRSHNIAKAASLINGAVVKPGEEFSFNNTVGPTTKNNGFMLGRIFVNGKEGKGYGGGVCQVSSTVYNAALKADMEITERHPHSKPVNYVPKNMDAATSCGVIDFKFKNNKDFPVKISATTQDEAIIVTIEKTS